METKTFAPGVQMTPKWVHDPTRPYTHSQKHACFVIPQSHLFPILRLCLTPLVLPDPIAVESRWRPSPPCRSSPVPIGAFPKAAKLTTSFSFKFSGPPSSPAPGRASAGGSLAIHRWRMLNAYDEVHSQERSRGQGGIFASISNLEQENMRTIIASYPSSFHTLSRSTTVDPSPSHKSYKAKPEALEVSPMFWAAALMALASPSVDFLEDSA